MIAMDGGVNAVEPPNGIVCSGGMTTTDPLCTEQFNNFDITALKVSPELGYAFNGWMVNDEPAKQTDGPLLLMTMPESASRTDLPPPGPGHDR